MVIMVRKRNLPAWFKETEEETTKQSKAESKTKKLYLWKIP